MMRVQIVTRSSELDSIILQCGEISSERQTVWRSVLEQFGKDAAATGFAIHAQC